ncbi:MAG: FKBP-type peptidyl-prolyl cis-trans isomerase [Verrucomicrobia bacterium]|nr:FKBP-type peptidyl-prolyl cis-trans isomerase [Verrucomicrobiota bacterium]
MKKQFRIFSVLSLLAISSLVAEETITAQPAAAAAVAQPVEIAKVSEAFGHVIGKNLENIGVKFDMAQVIKGLQDALAGKESPMSEMECIQAIAAVQEKIFKDQCAENLRRAETFLSDNKKSEGVIALEEGKVQYRVNEAGTGAVVEAHYAPLIKYTGKYLDGSVFGSSKEEEMISLDEIIPGLKAGLLGMKEGEKRTVYIHPDMAYGTNGYLPPNSLLTFDVEIVKANAPVKEEAAVDAQKPQEKKEIAEVKTDVR